MQPFLKSYLLLTFCQLIITLYTSKLSDSKPRPTFPRSSPGVVTLGSEFRSVWLPLRGGPCRDGKGVTPATKHKSSLAWGWESREQRYVPYVGVWSLMASPRSESTPRYQCADLRLSAHLWRRDMLHTHVHKACGGEKDGHYVWTLWKGVEFSSTHDMKTNSERLIFSSSKRRSSTILGRHDTLFLGCMLLRSGVTWMPGKSKAGPKVGISWNWTDKNLEISVSVHDLQWIEALTELFLNKYSSLLYRSHRTNISNWLFPPETLHMFLFK